MKTLPCLILLTAGLSCAAPASAADRLTELLTRTAANLPAGGIVLTTIEGETTHHHVFGQPHPDPALAPEQIVFEMGSITKTFTGLLLAQAVLEERLQLDDPIGPLLPPSLDLAPEVAAITLRQLATHTSGLPRLPDNFAPAPTPIMGSTHSMPFYATTGQSTPAPTPQPTPTSARACSVTCSSASMAKATRTSSRKKSPSHSV